MSFGRQKRAVMGLHEADHGEVAAANEVERTVDDRQTAIGCEHLGQLALGFAHSALQGVERSIGLVVG
ncbi:MAG: hypothetical protein LC799_22205, partial [Actinobacteria bacterium]|nr:hypothetical protein [Actinomycetota bacterium]